MYKWTCTVQTCAVSGSTVFQEVIITPLAFLFLPSAENAINCSHVHLEVIFSEIMLKEVRMIKIVLCFKENPHGKIHMEPMRNKLRIHFHLQNH